MINKETIISVFDEKLTLLQWLKTINTALNEAVLTDVSINKKGDGTYTFVFTFNDGTTIESNEIAVAQGDSVTDAEIVDGHLILTLSNENEIDAGNVKPVTSFAFNASRHLIVTYGDGTTQDLGLIKGVDSFELSNDSHLIVNYDNNTSEDLGSIFENSDGYSFTVYNTSLWTSIYVGAVKNGNKLTFVISGTYTGEASLRTNLLIGDFIIPANIGVKLSPYTVGTINMLDQKQINFYDDVSELNDPAEVGAEVQKISDTSLRVIFRRMNTGGIISGTTYYFRYEVTFLLSENLVS